MFSEQKENSSNYTLSQKNKKFRNQIVSSQKARKFNMLRQAYSSEALSWNIPYTQFIELVHHTYNQYSLLLTLFQISEDPLWRNKVNLMCVLIQKLHNICVQQSGGYLHEIAVIPDYQMRLTRIFYLWHPDLQHHFRLLIMVYITYNSSLQIFSQTELAAGLLHIVKLNNKECHQYLWLIAQIQTDKFLVDKMLKIVTSPQFSDINQLTLLPIITIMVNYVACEKQIQKIYSIINDINFYKILYLGLNSQVYELSRQCVLLCNNLITKDLALYNIIRKNDSLISTILQKNCQQRELFCRLISQIA